VTTVIYADTLFIVNFSMDFLSLYICARLMRYRIFPKRLAAAAAIGAAYALFSVIVSSFAELTLVQLPLLMLCAFLMAYTAFGGGLKKALGCSAAYLAVNLGLGGLMTVLFSAASGIVGINYGDLTVSAPDSSPVLFGIITVISAAVSIIYGKFKEQSLSQKNVTAHLKAFEAELKLTLMPDSGNLLRDPFSGKPVIIITANSVKNVFPNDINEAIQRKIPTIVDYSPMGLRLIPTHSLNGNGILLGFRPELVEIDGIASDAVIAVDPVNDSFDGCDGLVPTSLIKI